MSQTDTSAVATENGEVNYDESSIQLLQNRDHIRKRPGNYIPDTSSRGLHHLVYELVYNSVDEFLAGFCKQVLVTVHVDESLSVNDDGRGIPVDIHPDHKIPTLELVLTQTGTSGKFDNNAYKVSAGLHGIGAKAVNSLSEWMTAEVRRGGKTYLQEYERGLAISPVKELGAADRTGTQIHFFPDAEIFGDAKFDYDLLDDRLRELAFLNRGLSITLHDERSGRKDHFLYEGGVGEYVAWLNQNETTLHQPVYIRKEIDKMMVEAALQYNQSDEERIRCYANNAYNPNGGTHLSGFRAGLTRTLNAYGEKANLFEKIKPEGQDFRKGMTAVVNITLPNPQFESQTKVRLNNPEVEGAVQSAVIEVLGKYLEENPKEAKRIIDRVKLSAEEREAEAKARKAIRERKNILSGGGLPGKLMDCTTKDRDESEVFLVEGDSAGGSAESGRDRKYQAVLPLRGKPLNVQKARTEQMLKNEEIISIIAAMGTDIGNPDDISKLRYGKIVILTDADVDGQHIRTLLLTFFFRQMRKLIEEGHIYVARPPLFKVTHKKNVRFIATLNEMTEELFRRGLDGTKLNIQSTPSRVIEGDSLKELVALLDRLEGGLTTLERRGVNLVTFVPAAKQDGFPAWHVKFKGKEFWFTSSEEVETFRKAESERLGKELVIGDEKVQTGEEKEEHFIVDEFHEIRRTINPALRELTKFGFSPTDLIPAPRIAGREPPVRYVLEHDDSRRALTTLRETVAGVRGFGEKGMTITRFKGLGEMDPNELWDTTLNPENRTLLQVKLDDAQRANDLFTMLMGDEVDGRRNFIFEKGINVKDQIDYGS